MYSIKLICGPLIIATILTSRIAASMSPEDCATLGYNRDELNCDSCNYLSTVVSLDSVYNECKQCCGEHTASNHLKTYAKAVLHICNCNLQHYPQIEAFVRHRASSINNLVVRHVAGSKPLIYFYDHDGNKQEKIAIDKWDTDNVETYLRMQLETNQVI